jgi:spoIIIJ-associated protein
MQNQEILTFIQDFITRLGIPIDSIEEVTVADHSMYNVHTSESKRLIGPQGDTLRALNFILRRLTERHATLKECKFIVDVNGYQMVHIRDIESKARILADRVRTFRSSAEMTPMNSYERMIVHALFTNDSEIQSESEGTGMMRHVVLRYRTV